MGILASDDTGRVITLPAHCLIGRAAGCFVRIQDRRVSSEHARLYWADDHWGLRDLGSRNGTTCDGQPVPPGQEVVLQVGAHIGFGSDAQAWTLVDVSAPVAAAREAASGRVVVERDGMLRFPGSDPFPYVFGLGNDEWIIEHEDQQTSARDGEVVVVAGRTWTLHLPTGLDATVTAERACRSLLDFQFHFAVSADEEFVELTVRGADGAVSLGSRSHNYLLLTLARQRLVDDGWVYADDLARMLGLEQLHVNVQIFRARDAISKLDVVDAPALIERRRATRQLRLGTGRVSIETV
ncbi:MAG: hypothetical protein ACI8PZ_001967 [Myxococcota bacterium]|jgi:hypothetical protein